MDITPEMAAEFAALRCGCGCSDLVAIKPGQEPVRRGAVDLFTRLDPLVERGAPDVAWCAACHAAAFPVLNKPAATSVR